MLDTTEHTPALNVLATIKTEIVTAAAEKHAAVQMRLASARADHEKALGAVADADKGVTEAVAKMAAGDAEVDPGAMKPLQDAQTHAAFHGRLVASLERLADEAAAGIKQAQHEAHTPMYQLGRQVRLDAAKKADSAKALIDEAAMDFQRGTRIITSAMERGARHPRDVPSINLSARIGDAGGAEDAERAFWRGIEG